jgi:hypothetical protein
MASGRSATTTTAGRTRSSDENGDSVEMTYDAAATSRPRRPAAAARVLHVVQVLPGNGHQPVRPAQRPADRGPGRPLGERDRQHLPDPVHVPLERPAGVETGRTAAPVVHTTPTGSRAGGRRRHRARRAADSTTTDAGGKVTGTRTSPTATWPRSPTPSGLVTEYTYDALGRKPPEKEISDSFPAAWSPRTPTTAWAGCDHHRPGDHQRGHGVKHQQRSPTNYDPDGNVMSVDGRHGRARATTRPGSPPRVRRLHGRAITVDPEGERDRRLRPVRQPHVHGGRPNGNRYDYAYTARNDLAEVRLRDWHSDPEGAPATGTGRATWC